MESKKQVLVVDDEPKILRFVQVYLTLAGYKVITTTGGEEALELARSQKPDIILLDVLLGPMSGFDVLDKLRAFSNIPVIIFTGNSSIVGQALKHGANDSIAKPFSIEEVGNRIRGILGCTTADDGN